MAKLADLEQIFLEYGPCKIKFLSNYAFVDYDQEKDAEEAILNAQEKKIAGGSVKIEWSDKSGKNERRMDNDRKCYNCGSKNHKIRFCTEKKRRGNRSRSRSRNKYRSKRRSRSHSIKKSRRRSSDSSSSSRSRSRHRNKKKSRHTRSRSRSNSYSKKKK